ncbi:MAG: hypothetical protein ACOCZQ_01225 [Nanoarchaeota archaeon]
MEKVIAALMGIFGLAALVIFVYALIGMEQVTENLAMLLILFIVVLLQLAQTVVLIKIYEQH